MEPQYFDIHSHVNFTAFDDDRDAVIKRAFENGVHMINVGTQKETSESAVQFAQQFNEGMYATVGLHPIHAGGSTYHDKNELTKGEFEKQNVSWDYDSYKTLAQDKKVLAIGECGLDYYRIDPSTLAEQAKDIQKKVFREQISLANELNKPLMLHVRGERGDDTPYEEALEILKSDVRVGANFHFYAGSLEMGRKIWDAGFTTSFTGVITFARSYEKIIKHAPLDMIMTETDCPYAAPVPHRGKRNEPLFVVDIVKKIARIRGEDEEKVAEILVGNTMKMFNL